MSVPELPTEIMLMIGKESMKDPSDWEMQTDDAKNAQKRHTWNMYRVNKLFCNLARSKEFAIHELEADHQDLPPASEMLSQEHIARHVRSLILHAPEMDAGYEGDMRVAAEVWARLVGPQLEKVLQACAARINDIFIWTHNQVGDEFGTKFHEMIVEIFNKYQFPSLDRLAFKTDDVSKMTPFFAEVGALFGRNIQVVEKLKVTLTIRDRPEHWAQVQIQENHLRALENTIAKMTNLHELTLYRGNTALGPLTFKATPFFPLSSLERIEIHHVLIQDSFSTLLRGLPKLRSMTLYNVTLNPDKDRWENVFNAALDRDREPHLEPVSLSLLGYHAGPRANCDRDDPNNQFPLCSPYFDDEIAFGKAWPVWIPTIPVPGICRNH